MSALKQIHQHRSIRKYKANPVRENPTLRDRLPTSSLVHRDLYELKTDQQILESYERREIDGWDRYLANPELKKAIEKSGVTNLAQVYTILKYTKESHEIYSENIRKCLHHQGIKI